MEDKSNFSIKSIKRNPPIHIIFDFDGVLVESNYVKMEGFLRLFNSYPADKLEKLESYVHANGGISRYQKIQYFFEEILCCKISKSKINELAEEYSNLIFKKIINVEMVEGASEFLKNYHERYDLALVSGSDQTELRNILEAKKLDSYFCEILGSPVEKECNLSSLLKNRKWNASECLYIGDSINDLWACIKVGLPFLGRQSGLIDWRKEKVRYIENLNELEKVIGNITPSL